MKKQVAMGYIPYELGDKVLVHGFEHVFTVIDIKMTQYVASGDSVFEVLLQSDISKMQFWAYPSKIKERIKTKEGGK